MNELFKSLFDQLKGTGSGSKSVAFLVGLAVLLAISVVAVVSTEADYQLAFSNLVDLLVQLKLAPLPKLGIEAVFHQFWLASDSDRRWVGTGAFSKSNLGYISSASNGSNNVGQEIDLVVSWKPHRTTTLSGGFAKLFGGNVFRGAEHRDTDWAFIQLRVAY